MKLSEAPDEKSMLTVRPSAEFAGHPPCVSGLQFVYVWAFEGSACNRRLVAPSRCRIENFIVVVSMGGDGGVSRFEIALAHLRMMREAYAQDAPRKCCYS